MSTNIENNVVSMSFDNSNFESNAKTTLSTLDKLRLALNFSGSAKTLNEVSDAARGVDMSTLQNGVQEVHNRFSALEIMAITALTNITNRAVNAGVSITKALTIDSVMSGFGEYELMMNSVQTIMSGTGESLDTVMAKLNELNEYADDTIYVFSDMTQNIGKFTNAGVDLNTAVAAMKGLSNEAALSGANATEASRAMYNIAQSLSLGYMQYIDWKSIENANMATLDFKQNLVNTAIEMGTLTQAAVDAEPSINSLFKDKLKDGWLTNDVLLTTLQEYADETTELGQKAYAAAQDIKTFSQMWDTLKEAAGSGWAQTFGFIIGDFEQAKQLWTGVGNYLGNIISDSAKARNELLSVWNSNSGGREKVIQGLVQLFGVLQNTIGRVSTAFSNVFQGPSVVKLLELSNSFLKFATTLNEAVAPVADDIENTFTGVFSVLHMGVNVVTSIARAFAYLVSNSGIGGLASSIIGVTGNIGLYLQKVDEAVTENDTFFTILKKVADILLIIPNGLSAVFKAITGTGFAEAISKAGDSLGGFLGYLEELAALIGENLSGKIQTLKDAFGGLGDETGLLEIIFKGVAEGLSAVASVVLEIVTAIGTGIKDVFSGADTSNIMDFINTAGLAGALTAFLMQLKNLLDPIGDFGDMITNIREDLAILQTAVKADAILKIAKALAIMAVSCLLLASVDADKLAGPMAVITASMAELVGALGVMNKFSTAATGFRGAIVNIMNAAAMNQQATALTKLAASVLIMAVALKAIASIEPDRLTSSLVSITILLGELTAAAIVLNKFGGKAKTGGFILMAAGLVIIAKAVKSIASVDPERLVSSIFALSVLLGELTVAMVALSKLKSGGMMAGAAGMLVVASAMLVLTASVKILGSMDTEALKQGLLGMLGVIASVTVALVVLSKMNPVTLIAGAAALTVASGAILVLSGSIKLLSTISGSGLGTAMIALCGSLAALAVTLLVMKTALPGAAALIVAAGAIAILAPALALLSAIPFETMMLTLAGLAIAIAGLAVAAVLLTPILPVMAILAGVLVLFGAACTLVGAGVLALATGLATLAVSGVAGAVALVGILSVILGAIPMIVNAIALFVESLIAAYIELVPLIMEAVVVTITQLCETIITCIPTIVETIFTLIVSILTTIRDNITEIVSLGIEIVAGLIDGIAEGLPDLIDSVFNLVISLIDGLGQAIEDNAEPLREAMVGFCEHLWNAFCEFFGIHSPSTKMNEGGTYLIEGLIEGVGGMIESAKEKIGELKDAILGKLGEKIEDFKEKGKTYMTNLKDGLEAKRESIKTKAGSLYTSIKNKFNKESDFKTVGSNLITGLKNGMESMKETVVSTASTIGSAILSGLQSIFQIHSPSRVTFGFGEFLDMGLINGMVSMRDRVVDATANVATSVISALTDNLSDVSEDIDDAFDFTPTFTPVVDLSGIQNGVKQINSIFDDELSSTADLVVGEERDKSNRSSGTTVVNKQEVTNNYNFNQTNNSPKNIDPYESYRLGRMLIEQGARA